MGKGHSGLTRGGKIWNASRICVSSLRRGHANLLCIVPILVYVLPKRAQSTYLRARHLLGRDLQGVIGHGGSQSERTDE